jgi:hypothetical protein
MLSSVFLFGGGGSTVLRCGSLRILATAALAGIGKDERSIFGSFGGDGSKKKAVWPGQARGAAAGRLRIRLALRELAAIRIAKMLVGRNAASETRNGGLARHGIS